MREIYKHNCIIQMTINKVKQKNSKFKNREKP